MTFRSPKRPVAGNLGAGRTIHARSPYQPYCLIGHQSRRDFSAAGTIHGQEPRRNPFALLNWGFV
jgi:hypothetical protein